MVENFSKKQRSWIVATLCSAFRDYSTMRYMLGDNADDYDTHLAELIAYYVDSRLTRDWPVIGVRADGEIVAVAMGNEPVAKPAPDALQHAYERLRKTIGGDAFDRMAAFEAVSDRIEPDYPHFFLGMLGVNPDYQGRGYATELIERFRDLSAADSRSKAVVLSTEDSDNLPFYRKMGFEIIADAKVGELHTWCLAMPTPGSA